MGVRERLVLLAAQPAAGLGQQDLQAALVELRAVTGLAAGLTAALAHDLGLRGAAVVVDRAAGTQVEVEAAGWLGRTLAADRGAVRAVLRRGRRLDLLAGTRAALLAGTVTVEQADAIAVLRHAPGPRHPTTRSGSCCGPRTAGRHRGTWRCCRSRSGTAPTPTAAPTPSRSATTPGTCA